MKLYVDGVLVGTNPQTQAQDYTGYWRVGGDTTWGGNSSNYFAGTIDEVAVYSTALTAARSVALQGRRRRACRTRQPTAAFTLDGDQAEASFDGSGSTDSDGTIASYAWDFGDECGRHRRRRRATPTPQPGTYTVTLTVTDNKGATNVSDRRR